MSEAGRSSANAAAPVRVRVRYFAALRETLGPQETVEVEPGTTVAALRAQLRARSPAHEVALAPGRPIRIALDQVLVDSPETVPLVREAEIAFFPPVTGG